MMDWGIIFPSIRRFIRWSVHWCCMTLLCLLGERKYIETVMAEREEDKNAIRAWRARHTKAEYRQWIKEKF